MYFPYLRGRQYELLALRELVSNNLLGDLVIPIVEPVKLSSTLVNMMDEYIEAKQPISIIRNPVVGNFVSDFKGAIELSREDGYKKRFSQQYENSVIIKSLIMKNDVGQFINFWEQEGIDKSDLLVVNVNRDNLEMYGNIFGTVAPRYTVIPDESAFRRKMYKNKILIDDRFDKKSRNADYQNSEDDFFSDDHLYYKEDGFIGFSDYSVVGNEYIESGFAPYAVAIHIVYFADDKTLRIRHFVSDSNDDISNPALKFYEAVSKLSKWYYSNPHSVKMTLGLKTFLNHFEQRSYPGLGTVKKLSLMHHLELMGMYLSGA